MIMLMNASIMTIMLTVMMIRIRTMLIMMIITRDTDTKLLDIHMFN